jgi:hypothetical protein
MPAPNAHQQHQQIPLKIVGGNQFGRYPKISVEETLNMIVSDDALVPYAGYKAVLTQSTAQKGRGLYASSRGNLMVAVWGSGVYSITGVSGVFSAQFIGNIDTGAGDVYMSENNSGQVAITDGINIYGYNWTLPPALLKSNGGGISIPTSLKNPGYISFQNGRFLVADTTSKQWYLSAANDITSFPSASANIGSLESKPDTVQAVFPTPGGGNNIVVFGHTVMEQWQDVGAALFPYQRSSTSNVDFGTINASSIAALDNYVVWLAANESSGVSLMIYAGNTAQRISTDGIDYKLAALSNPEACSAFLFRQDGHIIYQFTFTEDNLSYIYDITTKQFFTVTDESLNYHIAKNVVFFQNKYYFVSLNGGDLFEFGTNITDIEYSNGTRHIIPQVRITSPIRLPDQSMYIIKSLSFAIENGQQEDPILPNTSAAIDLSVSRNGGESFGTTVRIDMNPNGKRISRLIYQRLGQSNDTTFQIRFIGYQRFVAFNGIVEIYQ